LFNGKPTLLNLNTDRDHVSTHKPQIFYQYTTVLNIAALSKQQISYDTRCSNSKL